MSIDQAFASWWRLNASHTACGMAWRTPSFSTWVHTSELSPWASRTTETDFTRVQPFHLNFFRFFLSTRSVTLPVRVTQHGKNDSSLSPSSELRFSSDQWRQPDY
ncbi:hypothetical protein ABW19_dt0206059 [Dactylella cylindrospora]|nr:hypothetical protein ABW19_dt0206059 [Dactylella cylindrospora]